MTRYLLRVKRRVDNEIVVGVSIATAKEVSDMIEYSDLQDDLVDINILLIDEKEFKLHRVCIVSETLSYESGSHYRYICKGTKAKYDEYGTLINVVDEVFYNSDH